jgi:hypothetical protein
MHRPFSAPLLDTLQPGSLSLGVPIFGDSVQVDMIDWDDKARLSVDIDPPTITIAREDDTPLQIERVFYDAELRATRRALLVKPVSRLVLTQENSPGKWSVVENEEVAVCAPNGFNEFIKILAAYAIDKQHVQKFKS